MAQPGQPAAKRRKLDLFEEVVVVVGSQEHRFTVPKCFLTKTSDFFKTCLNGTWKEAKDKTVKLPKQEPGIFAVYLQWLYTGDLILCEATPEDLKDKPHEDRQSAALEHYGLLVPLAILADSLADSMLSNVVVDAILRVKYNMHFAPGPDQVRRAYGNLPENSPLKRLLVDMYLYDVGVAFVERIKASLPNDFVFDLMIAAKNVASSSGKGSKSYCQEKCRYHVHTDNVPKCT
ncbi:hypothetical protein LTR36_006965 [Oleoguttula mirabilis]|uniref:BTB domain-containing protein n=1 Tax=Oleoguttula mirabilis TaxID=1507867 RepID=A0AAV9JB76_9PEZI|nr:hypothetical protein LTR36_006965 [Oleoguttula mirabilis]